MITFLAGYSFSECIWLVCCYYGDSCKLSVVAMVVAMDTAELSLCHVGIWAVMLFVLFYVTVWWCSFKKKQHRF